MAVKVYKRVKGKKITEIAARHVETQAELASRADRIAGVATGLLAMNRAEGHAEITQSKGRIDHYVNLDDTTGGNAAAAAIEFGRSGYRDRHGNWVSGTDGLAVLRRAAGIL